MPSMTRSIDPKSPIHKAITTRLMSRVQMATRAHNDRKAKWDKAEDAILAYVPETDVDAIRRQKRDLGTPQYTTIKIPYSYALLMAFHTYVTSVFFARTPVHQFQGRHGEGEMNVQAVETLISYQVSVGQFLAPYYVWLYDVGKYGVAILGEYWDKEIIQYGTIQEVDNGRGEMEKRYSSVQIPGYEGNKIYNISPYDFMHDPRVTVGNFQTGEFCVVRKQIPWNDILRRERLGYYTNVEEIKSGSTAQPSNQSSSQLDRPSNWKWDLDEMDPITGEASKHPAMVDAFEIYVELIPEEWGLGGADFPEKWVFTITRDYSVIIGAQPLGLIHGKFPFTVAEIEPEAYGLFNRGIPEIMEPIQNVMDWLLNTHFFNVRSSLNNQFLVDPSRVRIQDFEKGGAGLLLRARPNAYGTPMRDAILQLPVTDVTGIHMQDLSRMFQLGEQTSGINEQMLGQLGGAGRKTATEVRTSTGFGVNRQKTVAEYISAAAFSQHAQKLVMTTQQYYDQQKKFRIVGDQAQFTNQAFVEIDPAMIVGQYDFVPVDGTLPIDRFQQATLWKELFAQMRNLPQIAMQYDIAKIFAWVAQLAGLKNISQFRIQPQLQPDALLAQQAQAGNVVPIRPTPGGRSPGADLATQVGLNVQPEGYVQ